MAKHKQVVDADDAQAHPEGEGDAIMSNARIEASSDEQEDSFIPLMVRLESAIHRLKLAADDLSDLAEIMPTEEHGSAAFVVAETTEALNQLYRDSRCLGGDAQLHAEGYATYKGAPTPDRC
jgi:hypothetical protein